MEELSLGCSLPCRFFLVLIVSNLRIIQNVFDDEPTSHNPGDHHFLHILSYGRFDLSTKQSYSDAGEFKKHHMCTTQSLLDSAGIISLFIYSALVLSSIDYLASRQPVIRKTVDSKQPLPFFVHSNKSTFSSLMNLLDFPSEIFERIIAHYVRKNGIRRAWKRRIICKTFHSYIKTEIFGRQPPSAFSHRWHLMNPLVHRILPFILEHRAVALYGFPDVLPKIINKTVDIFLEITETSSVEARSEWTRIVCHTLVGQTPRYKTISLTFDPSKAQARMIAEQSGEQEALAIAVLVGKSKRSIRTWLPSQNRN
jgi:hypothetical protein